MKTLRGLKFCAYSELLLLIYTLCLSREGNGMTLITSSKPPLKPLYFLLLAHH